MRRKELCGVMCKFLTTWTESKITEGSKQIVVEVEGYEVPSFVNKR
jgi:hypothetical protein